MIDESILHFLLIVVDVTLVDRRNVVGKGSYGSISNVA